MTIQSIDVTTDLPESRERAVLLEMVVRTMGRVFEGLIE
jgi:hypothetical protein